MSAVLLRLQGFVEWVSPWMAKFRASQDRVVTLLPHARACLGRWTSAGIYLTNRPEGCMAYLTHRALGSGRHWDGITVFRQGQSLLCAKSPLIVPCRWFKRQPGVQNSEGPTYREEGRESPHAAPPLVLRAPGPGMLTCLYLL